MTQGTKNAIELDKISKSFEDSQSHRIDVLSELDLFVKAGELLVIVGQSGVGKTALLHIVSGALRPDSGEVRAFGQPLTGPNPHSITHFQRPYLLPWRNTADNVRLPLEAGLWKAPKAERDERVKRALADVGLSDWARARPKHLSGGMQQRLALARSVVVRPRIMLLDEPFSSLDEWTRAEMHEMLLRLWKQLGVTVVFVTHDIMEALSLADRIVVLAGRPARISGTFLLGSSQAARMRGNDPGLQLALRDYYRQVLECMRV